MIRLGLDLGVSSIGWALVDDSESQKRIIGMGSRIIPLTSDDQTEFTRGNGISKNQKRTQKRTQRKGYDRYQLRRKALLDALRKKNMLPDADLISLDRNQLWELRSNAVTHKIEPNEIGRVLLHINQKRGYKSSRSDANLDKKDTEYVAAVKSRHELLKERGLTIGQFFFGELVNSGFYRVKDQVYPREAYVDEFDAICSEQKKHYPELLTDGFINQLRNEIIFYQRRLKSQKGLVSVCEFEGFWKKNPKDNKTYFVGPKVAPKSSPLFQVCKIWENVNNIRLTNKNGETLVLSAEQKTAIFSYLDCNERLTTSELFKILGLRKADGWSGNKQIDRGIIGNTTKAPIAKLLGEEYRSYLEFTLNVKDLNRETYHVNHSTGEVLSENSIKIVTPNIEEQPLYRLWHLIYSISDIEECAKAIIKQLNIPEDIALKLANIDFTKQGFGNKSVKAMRKMLPYLMEGFDYAASCSFAGYNHSNSLTKEENLKRELLDRLPVIEKNSLRQPIVEKILNQLVNLVNAIIDKYGKPDVIAIELARELKQSKDERNETFSAMQKREREGAAIASRLVSEYGIRATRNNILKYRLYQEIDGEEGKHAAICIYCGKPISFSAAMNGEEVDIEHIIPKSLLFDDSQSNKTLAHRRCNSTKDNMTAYDFMETKSKVEFEQYLERINNLYEAGIIKKRKRDKLLMPASKIPKDFIDRQLRESQYIARKSYELLQKICSNVYATGGGVTEFLRRTWGWDDVLMNLQLPKYRAQGLTQEIEIEVYRQLHKKEIIVDWSKRLDHRHHAVDALTIACTDKSFIQRINTLSSDKTREALYQEVENLDVDSKVKRNLLEKYILAKQPFTTKQVMDNAEKILISFKAGKKVATFAKRKIKVHGKKHVVQEGIVVPRGALSEESVYGNIKCIEANKPLKYLFENPHLIYKGKIRQLVEERIATYNGDVKKAISSTKKEPIFLDKAAEIILEYATCYKNEYVIKYPVSSLKAKDISSVIDKQVREILQKRIAEFNNNEKEAFKDTENNPIWFNEAKGIAIKTVRCFTGLSAVAPVSRNKQGEAIGFVKPGNNHHVAIYIDADGKRQEHVCTFWHAVERKKYGFPVVIENPAEVWSRILQRPEAYPASFTENLPADSWLFELSMQQNEMFILGMPDEEYNLAMQNNDTASLSGYLYRVQKITSNDYCFRHHLETQIIDDENSKMMFRWYRVKSIKSLFEKNPHKIRINNLGEMVYRGDLYPLAISTMAKKEYL